MNLADNEKSRIGKLKRAETLPCSHGVNPRFGKGRYQKGAYQGGKRFKGTRTGKAGPLFLTQEFSSNTARNRREDAAGHGYMRFRNSAQYQISGGKKGGTKNLN